MWQDTTGLQGAERQMIRMQPGKVRINVSQALGIDSEDVEEWGSAVSVVSRVRGIEKKQCVMWVPMQHVWSAEVSPGIKGSPYPIYTRIQLHLLKWPVCNPEILE